jgi:hypothetical protein
MQRLLLSGDCYTTAPSLRFEDENDDEDEYDPVNGKPTTLRGCRGRVQGINRAA